MKDHNSKEIRWEIINLNGEISNYMVNDNGLVMNYRTGRLLAVSKDHNGYLYTSLYMNNVRYVRFIHKLVATAFVSNPDNKPVVNHLDSNPENNDYTNLEWVTQQENVIYAVAHGNKQVGSDCSFAKYTDEQIHHVCNLLSDNKMPMTKMVGLTGVSYATIYAIKEGRMWKHISRHYRIPKPIPNRHGDNHHSSKCTEDQVHAICQMLMDPAATFKDIIDGLNVKKSDINNIVQGKAWVYISAQYELPARERSVRSTRIQQLLADGKSIADITDIIMVEFGMPDRRKARHCVTSNIRYYSKMQEV